MAEGLIDEALEHFEMGLQVDRISADETIESRSCLASSLKNIGSLYQTKERISEAEACFIECCEILKSLADETGSVETQENLWAGYCSLAGIYEHEYRYTEAFEYYSKGLAILKRLVEETETVSSKYELSSCYVLIGNLHRIMGNRDEALSCYLEGIKLARDVVEKTNSIKSRRILAADYMEIGQLYKDSQYEDAIKYYEMSLEIIKAVSEATDCNDIKRDLIVCYYALGGVYESKGLIEEAEKLYKLAMEVPYVAPRKMVKKTVDLGNGVRIHIHTPAEEGS